MPAHGIPSIDLTPNQASGMRVAIISAQWNSEITDKLHHSAVSTAQALGAHVSQWRVAGALELPVAVAAACEKFDVVVANGCVIEGETDHFRLVCDAVTYGLTRAGMDSNTPVGNGVLTVSIAAQAHARAGGEGATEDKGKDATLAAIQAAVVLREIAAVG